MENQKHWDDVYSTKSETSVSWYQPHSAKSLEYILSTGTSKDASIMDVGSGASTLIDDLLAEGFSNVTALDIAEAGLAGTRERLGKDSDKVRRPPDLSSS